MLGAPRSLVLNLLLLQNVANFAPGVAAITVDWSSVDSVKSAASTIAYGAMSYYTGNLTGQIPGILPGPPPAGPYYWWEAGALWGTMIDYWHYTGDTTYNAEVKQAILHQTGQNDDFMPTNWTASLGNDDQGFWGMTAMRAAETNFTNPAAGQPQWLELAQGVFNTMASPQRHDGTCGGGLRWQIPVYNKGYNYKNSIANGCFFNIGARLYLYSGNKTFEYWANKEWNWERGVGFMTDDYAVYDGAGVQSNCTDINTAQYSYNIGVWLLGAAAMYNKTNDPVWKSRVDGLLNHSLSYFFPNQIATEVTCQNSVKDLCGTDSFTFKGFLLRWIADTAQLANHTGSLVQPYLLASAKGAVATCTGGTSGTACGFNWESGKYGSTTGCGQEMSALAAVMATMWNDPGVLAPLTNHTGGTSQGNANAGSPSDATIEPHETPITQGDRAGAWILTLLALGGVTAGSLWMSTNLFEKFSGFR